MNTKQFLGILGITWNTKILNYLNKTEVLEPYDDSVGKDKQICFQGDLWNGMWGIGK